MSEATPNPSDAGAANSGGDNPEPAPTRKPTAAATTTKPAETIDRGVGRTAKHSQAATMAKSGYVICTTPATAFPTDVSLLGASRGLARARGLRIAAPRVQAARDANAVSMGDRPTGLVGSAEGDTPVQYLPVDDIPAVDIVDDMSMPESHLHILLVLAVGDAHGYRIMHATTSMTDGAVKLRPGALYAALGRLVDTGLIAETDERPAAELDDQRRRYYRITSDGREALGAEIRRLAGVVRRATALEPSWGLG